MCISAYPQLKASLPALAHGLWLAECVNIFVFEGQHDEKLWQFLTKTLKILDNKAENDDAWLETKDQIEEQFASVMGYPNPIPLAQLQKAPLGSLRFLKSVV